MIYCFVCFGWASLKNMNTSVRLNKNCTPEGYKLLNIFQTYCFNLKFMVDTAHL